MEDHRTLSDTYEHASNVNFRFKVESFDSESGLMRIQTNSPLKAYQLTEEDMKANLDRVTRRIKEMEEEHEEPNKTSNSNRH